MSGGAAHACNPADGAPLSPEAMGETGDNQDRIVGEGLRHHESLQPLLRLRDHRDAVLLFTGNPSVPAKNNIAELDLRDGEGEAEDIGVPPQHGGGAISRTIIRTIPATARRQGWNMPDTPRQSLPEPGRHLRWISPSRHLVDTFPDCREITNLRQSPYEPLA